MLLLVPVAFIIPFQAKGFRVPFHGRKAIYGFP